MKIEKTLSHMFPGTSKLVIELVVEYALRYVHEEMKADSMISVQENCIVSRKPYSNSTMLDQNELEFEIFCAENNEVANHSAAMGMLNYAKLTGAIPANHEPLTVWDNTVTLVKDMFGAHI